jgi:lysophospholipase L1-like esterase
MKTILIAFVVATIIEAPLAAKNNYTYLALGDSVTFGMNVTLLPPYSQVAPVPSQFIGYPEVVASNQRLSELNASCPGETSGSFLNASVPDNGCNSPHYVPLIVPTPGLPPLVTIPPFKTTYGLHADYTGAQMNFALSQLKSNKNIDLVSLNIGANDVLLLLAACEDDPTCVGKGLGPVLQLYAANLAQILLGIRAEYQGTLVLMTYYSPTPALNGIAVAINETMTEVATQLSQTPGFVPITIVDGFTPFQVASEPYGGDPCAAGLVIPLPPGNPYNESPCDVHPSLAGRDLLASLLVVPPSSTACNGSYQGEVIGNLSVSKGETCVFMGGGVTGNITQTGGTLVLAGTVIGGNVQIQGGGGFSLTGSARVEGNLQIQNLPAGSVLNQICGVGVSGNLSYQNSAQPVQIGAMSLCPGNTVGGNLQVSKNTAAVAIFDNMVTGNLQVENDTSSTTVSGNKVAKNLQCSNNTTITGSGNTASQKQGQCAAF